MSLGQSLPHQAEDNRKESLSNPKILEVNLIKDEERVIFDWRRHLLFSAVILGAAGLLVAELYFGLDWWNKAEAVNQQSLSGQVEIPKDLSQIKSQADAALAYQAKAAAASRLLSNHVYWTKFFSWLEENTLNSVKFVSFSGDLSGEYSLSASAQNYAEVSWQAKAFADDPLVVKVGISSAVSGEKSEEVQLTPSVTFPLSLTINPSIFKK